MMAATGVWAVTIYLAFMLQTALRTGIITWRPDRFYGGRGPLQSAPIESYSVDLWPFWFWVALLAVALAGSLWAAVSLGLVRRATPPTRKSAKRADMKSQPEPLTIGRRLHVVWLWFVYVVACIGMGWSAMRHNNYAPGAPVIVSSANDIKRRIKALKSGR
jgi:hypothetical protein